MALTLSIIPGFNASSIVANSTRDFVVGVTNAGATAVTLQSLQVLESTESDAIVSQPVYLTPNVPVGVGNPILLPGVTSYFGFKVTFTNPYGAGPSPQAPGGANPVNAAYVNVDPFFTLQAQSLSSDGTIASTSLIVDVLSTIAPFPLAQGGALQLSQGFNLINLITSFG